MIDMINTLIERRANRVNEMRQLLEERADEAGTFGRAEDDQQYERLNADVTALTARIDELTSAHETNKKLDAQRAEYESVVRPEVREKRANDEYAALRELAEGKRSYIDIDFRNVGVNPARADRGWSVRDLVSNSATAGGNTVPTSFVNTIYEHMVENAAIRQTNVNVITTSGGENLEFPKTAVYGTAAIVGEGTAAAEADPTFGKVTLGAWKYAQLLQVTNELLTDTGVNLESVLAKDLGRALGNASGGHYITGSGTNQPNGVVTATIAQVGTAVNGTDTVPTADNLIDLFYSVIDPYARNGYWMMRRATEGTIRKTKGSDNNYLWQPGLQVGSPNLLLGRPIVTDPNVAAVGSAASDVIFGDFSAYTIRDVSGVRIERSDDFAFSSDLVTWRAILRTDGDLIDGTGAIKLLQHD